MTTPSSNIFSPSVFPPPLGLPSNEVPFWWTYKSIVVAPSETDFNSKFSGFKTYASANLATLFPPEQYSYINTASDLYTGGAPVFLAFAQYVTEEAAIEGTLSTKYETAIRSEILNTASNTTIQTFLSYNLIYEANQILSSQLDDEENALNKMDDITNKLNVFLSMYNMKNGEATFDSEEIYDTYTKATAESTLDRDDFFSLRTGYSDLAAYIQGVPDSIGEIDMQGVKAEITKVLTDFEPYMLNFTNSTAEGSEFWRLQNYWQNDKNFSSDINEYAFLFKVSNPASKWYGELKRFEVQQGKIQSRTDLEGRDITPKKSDLKTMDCELRTDADITSFIQVTNGKYTYSGQKHTLYLLGDDGIGTNIRNALTMVQTANDTIKEDLRNSMFEFEQFYKVSGKILDSVDKILEKVALNIDT